MPAIPVAHEYQIGWKKGEEEEVGEEEEGEDMNDGIGYWDGIGIKN